MANHRARVSRDFQLDLHDRMKKLWDAINSGWVFQDMSREDSDSLLEMLQRRANGMATDGSEEEDWYSQMGRVSYR